MQGQGGSFRARARRAVAATTAKAQDGQVWQRTCVGKQQLVLGEDVAIGEQPHGRNVIGQSKVNASCHSGLPQQIEPPCAQPT